MIGSALVLAILDLAVVVDGKITCPAPEAVARQLDQLMPPGREAREPDIADLSREGADLHLELRHGDGSWVAVRNIAGGRACDDLAMSVAVVIAAWEAELASGVTETVNLVPAPMVRRRSRRFGAAMLAMAAPNPNGPSVPTVVNQPASPPRAAPAQAELSLGLGGTLTGGSLATALTVDAFVRQADGPLALRVGLELSTAHRNDLANDLGTAEWRHFALDTGVRYRTTMEETFIDMNTSLKLAVLHTDVIGTTERTSSTVADFALGTGVRLGFGAPARRRVLPWVGLDFAIWSRNVVVTNNAFTATLPNVDVGLSVGILGGP